MASEQEIRKTFHYNKPTEAQAELMEEISNKFEQLVLSINETVQPSPYRSVAYRKLHEAKMYINASILGAGGLR